MKSSFIKASTFVTLSILIVIAGQIVISQSSEAIDAFHQTPPANQGQPDIGKEAVAPSSNLLGNRSYSDEGRLQQVKEVVQMTTLSSFLIGHGFGNGIPSRSIHMEISYLEIFHKQGVLGLSFWVYLLLLLYQKYKAVSTGLLSDAFFFSAVFVYFQSATNQYLNNPIGLSMILLSLVSLDVLERSGSDKRF